MNWTIDVDEDLLAVRPEGTSVDDYLSELVQRGFQAFSRDSIIPRKDRMTVTLGPLNANPLPSVDIPQSSSVLVALGPCGERPQMDVLVRHDSITIQQADETVCALEYEVLLRDAGICADDPGKDGARLENLRRLCLSLINLVDDPHPGTSTWQDAVRSQLLAFVRFYFDLLKR